MAYCCNFGLFISWLSSVTVFDSTTKIARFLLALICLDLTTVGLVSGCDSEAGCRCFLMNIICAIQDGHVSGVLCWFQTKIEAVPVENRPSRKQQVTSNHERKPTRTKTGKERAEYGSSCTAGRSRPRFHHVFLSPRPSVLYSGKM